MEEYASNSNKSKEQTSIVPAKKKVDKVVSGDVREKKRSGIEKFADREDVQNVKTYIVSDILVPALKDFCLDALKAVLWPGGGGPRRSKGTSERISYRRYYEDREDRRDYRPSAARSGYDFENYIIDNRGEAEEVLARMDEMIHQYGIVSVADYYDLLGISSPYTTNRYGWADIRSAQVVPVRGGGYMVKLPRAMPID